MRFYRNDAADPCIRYNVVLGGWRALIGEDGSWCVNAPSRGLAVVDGYRGGHVAACFSMLVAIGLHYILGWWRNAPESP